MVLASAVGAVAQNRSNLTPQALLESKKHYLDAARYYSENTGDPANVRSAGINFYRAGKYSDALPFLRKSDSLGLLKTAEEQYAYFECLKSAKRYNEADAFLAGKKAEQKDNPLFAMNFGKTSFYSKAAAYRGSSLEVLEFNTPYSEFGPTIYNGVLYFTSTRPSSSKRKVHRINMQPFYNLYGTAGNGSTREVFQPKGGFGVSEEKVLISGQSLGVLPMGINQQYHDGPVFVSSSGNHLFFTSNWEGKKGHSANSRIRLNIYHSVKENQKWSQPRSLPFNGKNWSTQHAVFDEATSTLYFSSNMPGGSGGYDIWTARLDDGKWSEAANLGVHVNTAGNEVFPALTMDGGLLFSSNGWPGLGGLDVFLSDDPQVDPINLLGGINSEADDLELTFTTKGAGYMVSNRAGSKGDDDVWAFRANLNDIRMEQGVSVPVGVKLSYKGGKQPSVVNLEVKEGEKVRLTDGPGENKNSVIRASEGAVITGRSEGFEPATTVIERSTIGNGEVAMTLEPVAGTGNANEVLKGQGGQTMFRKDFEDRSFAGLSGKLNGGEAVLHNTNDTDYNVTLTDGQRLQTEVSAMGQGTYSASARANGDATQRLDVMSDGKGNPAYTLQVSPDGTAREGWSLSSGTKVLASGAQVPARKEEWYQMQMAVRPDSVIAIVNGKVVGGAVNPDAGASAGAMSVGSTGTSQFDDLSFIPAGRTPRVAPGEITMFPAGEEDRKVEQAVRTDAGLEAMGENGDQVLVGGLEQIRREQPGFIEQLKSAPSTSVTAVAGNSGSDESMPMVYQDNLYVGSNRPVSGGQTLKGPGGAPSYRLYQPSSGGKMVLTSGGFGASATGSGGDGATGSGLPAGPDGKSYPGSVTVSSGGNWMVLGDGKGGLSYSTRSASGWSAPILFPYNNVAMTDAAQASGGSSGSAQTGTSGQSAVVKNREGYFDEASSTLYFSSDRPGGFGGYDIWKSTWDGKTWSAPVNAGPMVNSSGDEITPFVTGGGQLMYASTGWKGLGGFDLFSWKPGMTGPVNLPRGVNTSADDLSPWLLADGTGYVSSNRAGGKGGFDVYRFGLTAEQLNSKPKVVSSGLITNSQSVIPFGSIVGELEGTDASGGWLDMVIAEPAGSRIRNYYRIVDGRLVTLRDVNKSDAGLRKVTVKGIDRNGREFVRVIEVWPADVQNDRELLATLYFSSGKIGFRRISFGEAGKIMRQLKADASLTLDIDVYTDCTGSEQGNQRISERRAKWLVGYFGRKVPGSEQRIRAVGHGETNLVVSCNCDLTQGSPYCTREQNNRNRRAEIRRSK